MENFSQPSKNVKQRVFKTPIIVPLSIIMVVAIYVGYVLLFFSGKDLEMFSLLKNISFEVYILCEIGILIATIYNRKLIDGFLTEYPIINGATAIEKLKPVIRTNMYSALFNFFLIALCSLTAIMSILNHSMEKGIFVGVLSVITVRIFKWYKHSEESIKQIDCPDQLLETELKEILECWLHKPLPNF